MAPAAAEIGKIVHAIEEEVHPRRVILWGGCMKGTTFVV